MTEREAARTFALAYLRRLAHLGGAEALAAALPTTADAMVADGLAPRRHGGAECWALTAEADGRVVLTWPDGRRAGERAGGATGPVRGCQRCAGRRRSRRRRRGPGAALPFNLTSSGILQPLNVQGVGDSE